MNGMPPDVGSTDFGQIGATPAIDFWNSLLSAITALTQRQLLDSAELFQQAATGQFDLQQWLRSVISLSTRWFTLANFPLDFLTRTNAQIPTVFFILDKAKETDFQSVRTPFVLPNAQVEVTDLWNLQDGGASKLVNQPEQQSVSVELAQNGNRLDVRLVSMGLQDIGPGLYVGAVHARSEPEATRFPLAIITVLAPFEAARKAVTIRTPGNPNPGAEG